MRLRFRWGRRRLVTGMAALLVAVGGAGAWAATRSNDAAAATPTVVAASSGTIRQTVAATGTIEPAVQSTLGFAVGGTVTTVPVTVGDHVTKGSVLATVDLTDLSSAVELAQAALDAAVEQQTATANAGSSATQVASAAAQVAAAQSKLADARTSLADGTLRSPISGTVASVGLSVGDTVGSGAGPAPRAAAPPAAPPRRRRGTERLGVPAGSGSIVVISTGSWLVNASVDSADLASLKKGLQAEITPTGSSTKVFGTVRSVGIVASSATGTATFPVTIAVTGSPTGLYAGGTAGVAIVVKQIPNVLTVPTLALRTSGNQTVVQQMRNGAQVTTPVTVGTTYGATTQVLSGLKAGDQVVLTLPRPGGPGTNGSGGRLRRGSGTGGYPGAGAPGGGQGGGFPGGGGYPGGAGAQGGFPGGGRG